MHIGALAGDIGIFDSGVGGLSVLRAIHAAKPRARCVYLADNLHAPYGERSGEFVIERSMALAGHLIDSGCGMLVVACNTATAWAMDRLRTAWPHMPMVGVEPGLKPAAAATRCGRIGVLATPATLRSARYQRLREAYTGGLTVVQPACDGLAAAIERAEPDDAALHALLDRIAAELRAAEVDTVVLGCTHYPFVLEALRARLPAVTHWIDTGEAVARRVVSLSGSPTIGDASLHLLSTGPVQTLDSMASRWLAGEPPAARHIRL